MSPGWLAVVRQFLQEGNAGRASDEARRLRRTDTAAAFLAHELLKECYPATGHPGRAGAMAREACGLLRACQEAEARKLKPKPWGWR